MNIFLICLLPFVNSLKLGVLQTDGNDSSLCSNAILMAMNKGHCTTEPVELIFNDGCVPDRPARGTANAMEMYFKNQVNGFIAPACADELAEIGRLGYFWKRPVFARAIKTKEMLDVSIYPTVVGMSIISPIAAAKALSDLFQRLNAINPVENVSLVGPMPRSTDHYPLAMGIRDYVAASNLVLPIVNFDLFDERESFPMDYKQKIEQTGSKILIIAIDFEYPEFIRTIDISDFGVNGFLIVLVSPEPITSISSVTKKDLLDAKGIILAPILQDVVSDVSAQLAKLENKTTTMILSQKLSYFLSCYGYCYGTKYGTTGDTQDFYTVFKNKDITNDLGTFRFDASGSLMNNYGFYHLTEADGKIFMLDTENLSQFSGQFIQIVSYTSTSKSSCSGFDCFDLQSAFTNTDANYWQSLNDRQKAQCTYTSTCSSHWIWGWIAGGVTFIFLCFMALFVRYWQKRRNMNQYRMHWKLRKDQTKIIENKEKTTKGGKAETLAGKRRVVGNYALMGASKAEIITFEQKNKIRWDKAELRYLFELKQLNHDNLNKFVGVICNEQPKANEKEFMKFAPFHLLSNLIERASLEDFILDQEFNMDTTFRSAFLRDIVKGLTYLHKSAIGYHGLLTTSNCLIDGNWVLKLANFGFTNMVNELIEKKRLAFVEQLPFSFYLSFAPETLSKIEINKMYPSGSVAGDIYCLGIILHQVIHRRHPFETHGITTKDTIQRIINHEWKPTVNNAEEDPLITIMEQCWAERPDQRPKVRSIKTAIDNAYSTSKGNLVDQMLKMNEKYAQNLEKIVEERNNLLQEAQEQTMRLLNEILPKSIAAVLKVGGSVPPRSYDFATVLFVQVCDFQVLVSKSGPEQVIQFLNDIYDKFDNIINQHDAYKVETTGETYMVASGVPNENEGRHITEIAEISLEIRDASYVYVVEHVPDFKVRCKIGFHCGPIAAGVIGLRSPRYCLFGDTVNFASRMQSNCPPNQIQTSEVTALKLMDASSEYRLVKRGIVQVKGKGEVNCYWLNEHIHLDQPPPSSQSKRIPVEGRLATPAKIPTIVEEETH